MEPVFTAEEMKQIDAEAHAKVGIDTLIQRAGFAVARTAISMLGTTYGRKVVLFAGKGNNGQDGMVAASLLEKRGIKVSVIEVSQAPSHLPPCDLIIDAAFGTGFHGRFHAPQTDGSKVLAVDLPSGLDANTGIANGYVLKADTTISMGAYKPGLLLNDGLFVSGNIKIDSIGLEEISSRSFMPSIYLIGDEDVVNLIPPRPIDGHKWNAPLYVLAGSQQMMGAASLVASGAYRSGAGMVRLAIPGLSTQAVESLEAVRREIPLRYFADRVLEDLGRSKAVVMGPGLGINTEQDQQIKRLVGEIQIPLVVDADAIAALGTLDEAERILASRRAPTVITPHDGEYARLVGSRPGADRISAAANLARKTRVVVLLKGPTTVVADPKGKVLLVTSGSQNLSTAGTGDVLAGMIGAFIARGVNPFFAAALAAYVHGKASHLGFKDTMIASDLPLLVAKTLDELSSRDAR
ncbi:MAG: NAD(P)H-hydrate dehydratase [Firmicutes bacterium]|nr:NAD(P)H-hydrate dehydratase [Bacillota bacterium]